MILHQNLKYGSTLSIKDCIIALLSYIFWYNKISNNEWSKRKMVWAIDLKMLLTLYQIHILINHFINLFTAYSQI